MARRDCQHEPTNAVGQYDIAVVKGGAVVGHLPKKLSRIYSLFIRRGTEIRRRVAGRRRYSGDLPHARRIKHTMHIGTENNEA